MQYTFVYKLQRDHEFCGGMWIVPMSWRVSCVSFATLAVFFAFYNAVF